MFFRSILFFLSITLTCGRHYQKGCRGYLDIVFVIDASDSIKGKDFTTVRNSVANLIYKLNIGGPPGTLGGNGDARAGYVVYSSTVSSKFGLSSNRYALVHAAHHFKHARDGTNTRLAIRAMRKMFTRYHRDNTHKMGMIITDGRSKNTTETVREAEIARSMGIDLIAIGVTDDVATIELESIAGKKGRVLYVNDYDQLAKELEKLDFYKIVCPTTTTTTTTTTRRPTTTTTTTTRRPTTTTTRRPITTTTTTDTPITPRYPWTRPPTDYTTPENKPNLPRGLCDHCTTRDGVGYNPHPTDCTKFIQCYFGFDGEITISERQCTFGQFWSQDAVTCVSSQHVDCPTDKCKLDGLVAYPAYKSKNCREYWKCRYGQSYGLCCPPGEAFFPYLGCVKDESCNDLCNGETRKTPQKPNKPDKTRQMYTKDENVVDIESDIVVESPCLFKAIPGKPAHYLLVGDGVADIEMPCPFGTLYSTTDCACTIFADRTTTGATTVLDIPECRPEVYLPFDRNARDESPHKTYIENHNVRIKNGYAVFTGRSKLVIPRFSNLGYYSYLLIKIRYKADIPSRKEAIFSNGDICANTTSMAVTKLGANLNFQIMCEKHKNTQFQLPSIENDWNDVEFIHDGKNLEGMVNDLREFRRAPGQIKRCHSGLQIGYRRGFRGFKGKIDGLTIYLCKPKLT